MDVTVTGGTFLHELSMVERAQHHSLITGVTLAQETADVQCVTGPSVTVPLTAGRIRIAQLLSEVAGPITPPAAQDPDTYPDTPAPQQLWSELLDDLGAYLPDLSHADPDLRQTRIGYASCSIPRNRNAPRTAPRTSPRNPVPRSASTT